jgi:hypothetical protein
MLLKTARIVLINARRTLPVGRTQSLSKDQTARRMLEKAGTTLGKAAKALPFPSMMITSRQRSQLLALPTNGCPR